MNHDRSARLVTANLLHGVSLGDGRVDNDLVTESLCGLSPNVLAVQEVDAFQERSEGVDQTATLAEALAAANGGTVNWRFVPAIRGVPGGQWTPATEVDVWGSELAEPIPVPSYGVGLLCTWPVRSWHVRRLAPFRFKTPVFIPGLNQWIVIADEPRVCVIAVVDAPWGVATVAATHLSFVPGWSIHQLRQVACALADFPSPRLLLGDLNVPRPFPAWSSPFRSIHRGAIPTFPGPQPRLQIDHVLRLGPAPRGFSVEATSHDLGFSDHRILVVDLHKHN